MKYISLYRSVLLLTLAFISCARLPSQQQNQAPEILSLRIDGEVVNSHSQVLLLAEASDPEGDSLSAQWSSSHGFFLSSSLDSALWRSPDSSSHVSIYYSVSDDAGNLDADTLRFWVSNRPPQIESLWASEENVLNGNTISLSADVVDPDSHQVDLFWSTPFGILQSLSGDTVRWTAPDSTMRAWVAVDAVDTYGAESSDTLEVSVYSEVGCVWIINTGGGEVVKLSAIGDELLRIPGFSDPQDLDIDPENRRLWVCESTPPAVHAYDLAGNLEFSVNEFFYRPTRLSAWFRTGSVFVIDADSSMVLELGFGGDRLYRSFRGFNRPNALDVFQSTGELWVCDEGNNNLYQIHSEVDEDIAFVDSSEFVTRRDGYSFPVDVSVEDSTGACWLVDKEAGFLVRYEADALDSLVVYGFQNPVAVSAAWSDGLCWVLDRGLDSRAVRLFFDNEQAELGDLSFPRDLAFNRLDSHCWVLDSERNRVLRVDPDGQVVGTWTDFNFPGRIVINSGY